MPFIILKFANVLRKTKLFKIYQALQERNLLFSINTEYKNPLKALKWGNIKLVLKCGLAPKFLKLSHNSRHEY